MAFTSYASQNMIKSLFGGGNAALPATLYFGLSTTTVAIDGTGITEPSGNGYARVAMTNNGTNFPVTQIATGSGGGAEVQDGTAINFPQATGSWGTVSYWFVSDAASGGNIIAYGALSPAQAIVTNNTPSFGVDALTIQNV